jgi:hypothetical protein
MLRFFYFDASSWIRGIARIAGLPPQQAKTGLAGDPGIAKDRRNWKSSAVHLSVFLSARSGSDFCLS